MTAEAPDSTTDRRPGATRFPSRRVLLGGASAALLVGPALTAMAGPAQAGPRLDPSSGGGSVGRAEAFLRAMTDAYPDGEPGAPDPAELRRRARAVPHRVRLRHRARGRVRALTGGRRTLGLARTIGDGLVYAQEHDPGYDDGRLRQGYNVGPYIFYDGNPQPHGFVLPDGTANIGWQFGFLGTAVGDMAWPGIALVQLYAPHRRPRYLDAAIRIGTWITTNAVLARLAGRVHVRRQRRRTCRSPTSPPSTTSTASSFFGQLTRATGDAAGSAAANGPGRS